LAGALGCAACGNRSRPSPSKRRCRPLLLSRILGLINHLVDTPFHMSSRSQPRGFRATPRWKAAVAAGAALRDNWGKRAADPGWDPARSLIPVGTRARRDERE